jgi:ABC-type multidrug transport system ATPase subunit
VTAVLEICGLQKTYRSRKGVRKALDGFDMVVEQGQVHGFLGPNGAGKTTTLRTLLGLIKPNGGRMVLLGREVPAALPEVAGLVGAIVESPQFFGAFSAQDTLSLLADAGGVDQRRIVEVLPVAGLGEGLGGRLDQDLWPRFMRQVPDPELHYAHHDDPLGNGWQRVRAGARPRCGGSHVDYA